jgi:hypothetical protein
MWSLLDQALGWLKDASLETDADRDAHDRVGFALSSLSSGRKLDGFAVSPAALSAAADALTGLHSHLSDWASGSPEAGPDRGRDDDVMLASPTAASFLPRATGLANYFA